MYFNDPINNIRDKFADISLNKEEKVPSSSNKESDVKWMDEEAKIDWESISCHKDNVIAGFLGIGEKDGCTVKEEESYETGFRFVRFMLRKFWHKNSYKLGEYRDIIIPTVKAFSPSALKVNDGFSPRATIDSSIKGWQQHAISRLIGNVCKAYQANGPFFEVLINSQSKNGNSHCFPFSVTVLENYAIAKERWEYLSKIQQLHQNLAYQIFYSSKRCTPSHFIQAYQKQMHKMPGPNSLRLLKGLEYIEDKKMKAQTIGNCWMKQNKRAVLLSFYLEAITQRPELSHDQAWRLSQKLYAKWKQSTKEEVLKLLTTRGLSLDLVKIVKNKIEKEEL